VLHNNITVIKAIKNGEVNYSESIKLLNDALNTANLTK
jgi:hypothetical protein